MTIETERLLLRPWKDSDAASLCRIAKDERVGKSCGWLPHRSEAHSRMVIQGILSKPETYAIPLKDSKALVGSIGLSTGDDANIGLLDNDGEIGFWIDPEYWGNGYAAEALRSMVDRAFGKRHVQNLCCCISPATREVAASRRSAVSPSIIEMRTAIWRGLAAWLLHALRNSKKQVG